MISIFFYFLDYFFKQYVYIHASALFLFTLFPHKL